MENQRKLSVAKRHPLVFGIIVTVLFFLVMNITGLLLALFGPKALVENGEWLFQGVCECVTALFGIAFVAIFGYGGIWGERGAGIAKGLVSSGYFIVVSAISLASSIAVLVTEQHADFAPAWSIAVFIVTVFLIGLAEESFFRGVIANLFYDKHANDPAGVWTAVIGSGMVFGLMHLPNMLASDVVGVLVQTAAACCMGMTLTAIYFRCRNIWVNVLVHAFLDFCGAFLAGFLDGGSLTETISEYDPSMFVSVIPYIVVTFILLRPSKVREIIDYRNESLGIITQPEYDEAGNEIKKSYRSSKRSKKGLVIAAVLSVLILLGMFSVSVELSGGIVSGEVFSYSLSGEWDGEDPVFTTDLGPFEVLEDGDYTLVIISYPGSSKASVSFTVTDPDGNKVYNDTLSGRSSVTLDVELEAGKGYSVLIEYDFSTVGEPISYVTNVRVTNA